jgi:beta-glucanase (GH16 family)
VYAIDWSAKKIDFLMDGKLFYSYKNEGKGEDTWPFDKPFYLIMNFAFGGAWGGQKGVDIKSLPLKYYIDYVRVYQ